MTQQADILELVDCAYQAAVDPSLWTATLSRASKLFGGRQAVMMRSDLRRVTPSPVMNTLGDPLALPTYMTRFEAINPIQAGIDQTYDLGFRPLVSTDQTYVARAELERSDFYNGYLRRFDMHSVLLMALPSAHVTLNIMRPPSAPLFDGTDLEVARAVQPAFARAFEFSERLAATRAVNEGLADFVERSPCAVVLVGEGARVVHANAAAEALLGQSDGLKVRGGVLEAADAGAARRLSALIGQAAGTAGSPRGGGLSLPRPSGRRALAVLVAPARSGFGGEGGRLALVSVVDPDQAMSLPPERMRELFGLTLSEARVTAELAAGHGPREIAERMGVSFNTVRVQLARAMAKTETTRQSDLVALVIRTLVGGALG